MNKNTIFLYIMNVPQQMCLSNLNFIIKHHSVRCFSRQFIRRRKQHYQINSVCQLLLDLHAILMLHYYNIFQYTYYTYGCGERSRQSRCFRKPLTLIKANPFQRISLVYIRLIRHQSFFRVILCFSNIFSGAHTRISVNSSSLV